MTPRQLSLSHPAREVLAALEARGASFFADLVRATRRLPSEVEDGLWELVAAGLVTADGFENLRALIDPKRRRGEGRGRTARPRHAAGRWALLREMIPAGSLGQGAQPSTSVNTDAGRPSPAVELFETAVETAPEQSALDQADHREDGDAPEAADRAEMGGEDELANEPFAFPSAKPAASPTEAFARQLLARWGVVFRDILERETLSPPWRDLLVVLRRLEARGEIRGGRFVEAFRGEQFALREAVDALRAVRRAEPSGEEVTVSAADPLNLVGIILPGPRLNAAANLHLKLRDGVLAEEPPNSMLEEVVALSASL